MECEKPAIVERITTHVLPVYAACFSPDQTTLCSAGNGKVAILTSLFQKKEKVLIGHTANICSASFSSNGNLLATSSADRSVRIWTSKKISELKGHTGYVYCVIFLKNDSTKVISGCSDQNIKIWDIERKKEISTLSSKGYIWRLDILPDNSVFVSGSSSGSFKLWDFRSGKCVETFKHHQRDVYVVKFHPNAFSIVSGGRDRKIKIFDYRNHKILQEYQVHTDSVISGGFHPSGKFFISGSADKTIKLFDLREEKVLYTMENAHSDVVSRVQFSPDGKYFVSGSWDSKVYVWDFPLGRNMFSDIDEEERVDYLWKNIEDDNRDCVFKITISSVCSLKCYKFLF